jgi:hypothetical protein
MKHRFYDVMIKLCFALTFLQRWKMHKIFITTFYKEIKSAVKRVIKVKTTSHKMVIKTLEN